jgi:HEAT repeats
MSTRTHAIRPVPWRKRRLFCWWTIIGGAVFLAFHPAAAMANEEKPNMSQLLEAQIKMRDGDARDTARQLGPAALPVLNKYIASESPETRSLVLECYGEVKDDGAIIALAEGLTDADINVRKTAVLRLHKLHGLAAVPKLHLMVAQSPYPFVRGNAALILGRIGSPSSSAVVSRQCLVEKDALAIRQMTLAVARLEDGDARKKVILGLAVPGARERYDAIADLEYLNLPALAIKLEPLLSDTRIVRNVGTEPFPVMHRVCDRAIEAAAFLLPGKLTFKTGFKTYTPEQIEETRRLLMGTRAPVK